MSGFAIVVGVTKYANYDGLPQQVANDAVDVGAILKEHGYQVEPLVGSVSRDQLLDKLRELEPLCKDDSTFVLFFSGHGKRVLAGPSTGEYLILSETSNTTDPEMVETSISGTMLATELSKSRGNKVLIFDCCHSQALGKIGVSDEFISSGPIAVIVASQKDQLSLAIPGQRNSLFTKHLVDGLKGKSADRDGKVTAFHLATYVKPRVQSENDKQEPSFVLNSDDVVLFRVKQSKPDCPYPGMRPFTEENANLYFGRDDLVRLALNKLLHSNYLFVIGPSGCGKSSLALAGIPKEKKDWKFREFRPGYAPFTELKDLLKFKGIAEDVDVEGAILESLVGDERKTMLLVIDQFETLYTQSSSAEREQFETFLLRLRNTKHCKVVITLRADFISELMSSRLWFDGLEPIAAVDSIHNNDFAGPNRLEIAPMRSKDLSLAISKPAEKFGVCVAPDLRERLISDASSSSGAMPLLQETLVVLWDGMEANTLTLSNYERIAVDGKNALGSVLNSYANSVWESLSKTHRATAERMLVRLVTFVDGKPPTRAQLKLKQLVNTLDDEKAIELVSEKLISARILTGASDPVDGERRVEISHDRILSEWEMLSRLLASTEMLLLQRKKVEGWSLNWQELGGNAGILDAVELSEAERVTEDCNLRQVGYLKIVDEHVAESKAYLKKIETEKVRSKNRTLIAVSIAAVVLGVLAVYSMIAQKAAESARTSSLGRFFLLTADQILNEDPGNIDLAVAVQLQAIKLVLDNASDLSKIQFALNQTLQLVAPAIVKMEAVTDFSVSRSGKCLGVLFNSGKVCIFNFPEFSTAKVECETKLASLESISDDGNLFAGHDAKQSFELWDCSRNQKVELGTADTSLGSIEVSSKGDAAILGRETIYRQGRDASWHEVQSFDGEKIFSPDGKFIVGVEKDCLLSVNAATLKRVYRYKPNLDMPCALSFNKSGNRILFHCAWGDRGGNILASFNPETGQFGNSLLNLELGKQLSFVSADVSPMGNYVFVSTGPAVRVFDCRTLPTSGDFATRPFVENSYESSMSTSPIIYVEELDKPAEWVSCISEAQYELSASTENNEATFDEEDLSQLQFVASGPKLTPRTLKHASSGVSNIRATTVFPQKSRSLKKVAGSSDFIASLGTNGQLSIREPQARNFVSIPEELPEDGFTHGVEFYSNDHALTSDDKGHETNWELTKDFSFRKVQDGSAKGTDFYLSFGLSSISDGSGRVEDENKLEPRFEVESGKVVLNRIFEGKSEKIILQGLSPKKLWISCARNEKDIQVLLYDGAWKHLLITGESQKISVLRDPAPEVTEKEYFEPQNNLISVSKNVFIMPALDGDGFKVFKIVPEGVPIPLGEVGVDFGK